MDDVRRCHDKSIPCEVEPILYRVDFCNLGMWNKTSKIIGLGECET